MQVENFRESVVLPNDIAIEGLSPHRNGMLRIGETLIMHGGKVQRRIIALNNAVLGKAP